MRRGNPFAAVAVESRIISVAAAVGTRLDPRISAASAQTIRTGVAELLAEMAADPTYAALRAAALPQMFARRGHHAYVYRPFPPRPGPGPLLVALHGHGGNFAAWVHSWRAFADRSGYAVVAPTWGFGNWERRGSPAAVAWAIAQYRAGYGAPEKIILAGLSQGGAGVGRAARALPGTFAGLVFLSATTEPAVLRHPGSAGMKMLFAWGGADRNVSPASVRAGIAAAAAAGAIVTEDCAPAADHFDYFARRPALHARIAAWAGG